jgi:ABC-type multidrug transport system ATPase subunit
LESVDGRLRRRTRDRGRLDQQGVRPVRALSEVSIEVRRGSVFALFGDNGAGKSVLTKCLCGVHKPDSGELVWLADRRRADTAELVERAGGERLSAGLMTSPQRPRRTYPT